MKKLWDKIVGFFAGSNRPIFAFYGFIITFVLIGLLATFFMTKWIYIVVPFVGSFIAFLTAFLKDKTKAGAFNWGDILAGMLGSFGLTAIMLLAMLLA